MGGRRRYIPPPRPFVMVPMLCWYDVFGDTAARYEGTLADVASWREPERSLQRMCRQCYADWLTYDESTANHMVKRLYEQLTGKLDAAAALRDATYREYTLNYTAWEPIETPRSQRDRDRYGVIDGLRD